MSAGPSPAGLVVIGDTPPVTCSAKRVACPGVAGAQRAETETVGVLDCAGAATTTRPSAASRVTNRAWRIEVITGGHPCHRGEPVGCARFDRFERLRHPCRTRT